MPIHSSEDKTVKRILVPNGNYTDIRLIKAFKKMGFYVITSGNDKTLEGHKYADEYVPHDYSDKEGMLELAKSLNLDYVSACSNDFGVTTAAYIAEKLGLPGHDTYASARIIAEKDLYKQFAKENHLQIIPSEGFSDYDAAVEYARKAEYPIIVKPTDLGGGKGVTRLDSFDQAEAAIRKAFDMSKAKNIVIEPFIVGTQHSITTFLVNRKVVTYTSFNEYDAFRNPFLVGYTTSPADDMEHVAPVLVEQIEKMAELLHCVDGIFHVQYRMHHGKPLIMECMRRCLGNYALEAASYLSGLEWEEWIARSYCGMDCSGIPHNTDAGRFTAHFYIQPPRNGIVKNVTVDPCLEPYILHSIMQWEPGTVVHKFDTQMLGFLILAFPNMELRDRLGHAFPQLVKVEMQEE